MANPTCTSVSLVENFPCLSGRSLTIEEQKAIKIWFNVKELAALGGTDYSAVLTSTLISDATTLAYRLTPSQFRTAYLAIAANNAVAAGATIPSSPDTLMENVKCLKNYPNLKWIDLLLTCALGKHATFPQ